MYSRVGRPSVPPEQLLKASILMALYSMRSERAFCERLNYDLLFKWFLDFPIDAKAFEPLADGFIMVAEWGATPRALVRTTLQAEPQIGAKMLGLILNKADYRKLSRYGSFGSSERFLDRYSSYYLDYPKPTKTAFRKVSHGAAVALRKLGSMALDAYRKRAERRRSDLHAPD